MTTNPFLEIDREMTGDIYTSDEIWENMYTLCDEYGSRFAGTPGERLAAEFLAEKLKTYGLKNIDLEPVEYLGWERGEATLEVLSPVRKQIPCISLPHCPPGEVEAVLVDMGDGAPGKFEERAGEIDGKIVLTTSETSMKGVNRWIHRGEKFGRSIMAGAAGFIFVNHYPAYGAPTGGIAHGGRAALIPGVGMSYENGTYLQRLAAKYGEVRIRLTTRDSMAPAVSWNVVGEIPGRTDEIVMFGSHYDGHDISQGAQDPASGTAAVLEAARVLAAHGGQPACKVRVVFWGIEEIGLLGSKAYAKTHEDELDKIRFYFNMDSAGAVNDKGVNLNEWPELAPLFEQWAAEMALPFLVGQTVGAHSDHFPFFQAGVPTGGMESVKPDLSGRGYGHTAYDTLDKVNLASLREAAAMASRLILRVANESNWPVQRRSREAVQKLFRGPQYEEEARYRERMNEYLAQNL